MRMGRRTGSRRKSGVERNDQIGGSGSVNKSGTSTICRLHGKIDSRCYIRLWGLISENYSRQSNKTFFRAARHHSYAGVRDPARLARFGPRHLDEPGSRKPEPDPATVTFLAAFANKRLR